MSLDPVATATVPDADVPRSGSRSPRRVDPLLAGAIVLLVALASWRLADYPLTWYDEGSHLHVPKTLVLRGVYADYSSEGFRYYGPTIGVGPTVLLPIAAVFEVTGTGLFQARAVVVLYLLAAVAVFWRLAGRLGGRRFAWVATALLVSSPGVGLFEYGRQVLGEVPGLFFLAAGLLVWFDAWERPRWWRLAGAGLLLGLAVVTKTQFFIVIAPTLALAWLANLAYYRSAPQRAFLVPGIVVGAVFAAWQAFVVVGLGPGAAAENLALYRAATASAATVFSPALIRRGLSELLSAKVYLGWLLPALAYGVFLARPRGREGHRWCVLLTLVSVNLAWYVVASVSWIRYAFPALAVASLLVARLFADLTGGYHVGWRAGGAGAGARQAAGLRAALLAVLVVLIGGPLGATAGRIVAPPFNAPLAMAQYLDQHVPTTALVETWEPELGFLTGHRYHFPPQSFLYKAVRHVWVGGPAPAESYHFVAEAWPDYIVVGPFADWVGMYAAAGLETRYTAVARVGGYRLLARDAAIAPGAVAATPGAVSLPR
jgi:4-amino-4-deoxy-L-arabinose transferase-like glycosyltransferase